MFCSLGAEQTLCRVLLRYPQDKIESQHLLRIFSDGFVAEVKCFEVTAFNLWNSSSNSRSTLLFPLVKQKDLSNCSDSCVGKVFTAGGFTHTLIQRQHSVSHCLSSFPPQVDIVQTCIIEMKNRPGKPLFHLEHYIEGKYIKYNSNSGFVRDDNIRLTPQVRLCLMLSTECCREFLGSLQRSYMTAKKGNCRHCSTMPDEFLYLQFVCPLLGACSFKR